MTEIRDSLNARDIEQAEREVIGIALRHPNSWPKLAKVRPEWFHEWRDQQLWQAIQRCYECNEGMIEDPVLADLLQEMFGDDAADLAARAVDASNTFLHAEHVEFNVALLDRMGTRLAIRRQAHVVVEMCDSRRPMAVIRDVLAQPPIGSEVRA